MVTKKWWFYKLSEVDMVTRVGMWDITWRKHTVLCPYSMVFLRDCLTSTGFILQGILYLLL